MSTLMFWNKQNANNNNNNTASQAGSDTKNGGNKKEWLHSPDTLINGHVAYLVKFLGATPVDQAKGIDTVKDAIRRLQFSQQLKKADGNAGKKSNKVELTISVDGVAVQEPRVQKVLHQFPLHDISYCADEKGVKKFFSFIAKTSKKDADTNGENGTNNTEETHTCFVFISSKLASDITMTIGQAFELAYRRYVSDGSKGSEMTKLQVQTKQLENTVHVYQQRLRDLAELLPKSDVARLVAAYGVRDLLEVPALENGALMNGHKLGGGSLEMGTDLLANNDDQLLIETSSSTATTNNVSSKMFGGAPMVPPRNQLQNQINSTLDAFKPSVGTKLEGLLLHSDSDSDFDPRADESDTSSSYTNGGNGKQLSNDLFGFEPSSKTLGQQLFTAPVPAKGNGVSNGSNGGGPVVNGNGNGYQVNPTPLLAPPPKAVTPRRPAANNSSLINNNNGSQDLFGSTPFNAMQPSPFDDDVDASFGASQSMATSNHSQEAFSDCVRDSSTVFPRAPAPLSNPFGDPIAATLNETTHSAFDDSFDRGFDSVSAGPTKSHAADPFVTSSPSASFGSHNCSSDLSGINFSAASLGSPLEQSVASSSAPPAASAACKPNYHAFYSLSETLPTTTTSLVDDKVSTDKSVKLAAASLDIFQSVAASAFQQFGNAIPSGAGFANAKKNADPAVPPASAVAVKLDLNALASKAKETGGGGGYFGGSTQNNFNTKTMAFDDFTLESLDPLRK